MFRLFTDTELTACTHKTSLSADWRESVKEDRRIQGLALALQELFLLSNNTSTQHLEEIIASTDAAATPLINVMI
jgi:hypothetical protein